MSSRLDPTCALALEDLADLGPRLEAAWARASALPPGEREAVLSTLTVLKRELELETASLARRRAAP